MAAGKHFTRGRRHSFLGILCGLVLAALVAFSVVIGLSGFRLYRECTRIRESLESYEVHIADLDVVGAKADAQVAEDGIAHVCEELKGLQWELVRAIPYIGHDVTIATDASAICHELVGKALLPVLDDACALKSSMGANVVSAIVGLAGPGSDLVDSINDAEAVISDCDKRAQALPASHFDFINGFTGDLKDSIASSQKKLNALEGALGVADFVTGLIPGK